jgi:UDP-glucose 4-epimerase
MLGNEPLTIFGDGEQTRDFINVHDVVQANIKAAMTTGVSGAFNIGSGTRVTINDLVDRLRSTSGIEATVTYGPPRLGDVRDSLADISAAKKAFGFAPAVDLESGLAEYVQWAFEEASSVK